MSCKFEVGDRVRVREYEDMANEYPVSGDGSINPDPRGYTYDFVSNMRAYCGKCGTITGIRRREGFRRGERFYEIIVKFDNHKGFPMWSFAEYMFEHEHIVELPNTAQLYDF